MKNKKFRPYFMLHMKYVASHVIGGLILGWFVGWIWKDLDLKLILVGAFMIASFSMQIINKVCSVMLYQREAYLYQSFPVSHFETALTKIVTCALTPAAIMIPAAVKMYGLKGCIAVPAILTGCLLVSGIVLAAIGFGNGMRDSRAKKPSTWGSVIAAVIMLGAQTSLTTVFVKYVPMSFGLKILILTIVFAAEAAGMLWFNTNSLRMSYQA